MRITLAFLIGLLVGSAAFGQGNPAFNSVKTGPSVGTKPTCTATDRFRIWTIAGATGVADLVEVCDKDDLNVYAWRPVWGLFDKMVVGSTKSYTDAAPLYPGLALNHTLGNLTDRTSNEIQTGMVNYMKWTPTATVGAPGGDIAYGSDFEFEFAGTSDQSSRSIQAFLLVALKTSAANLDSLNALRIDNSISGANLGKLAAVNAHNGLTASVGDEVGYALLTEITGSGAVTQESIGYHERVTLRNNASINQRTAFKAESPLLFDSSSIATLRSFWAPDASGVAEFSAGVAITPPITAGEPTCDVAHRFWFWTIPGATTVADKAEVCDKDAADVYAWRDLVSCPDCVTISTMQTITGVKTIDNDLFFTNNRKVIWKDAAAVNIPALWLGADNDFNVGAQATSASGGNLVVWARGESFLKLNRTVPGTASFEVLVGKTVFLATATKPLSGIDSNGLSLDSNPAGGIIATLSIESPDAASNILQRMTNGGTSYTVNWPPSQATGFLKNDGSGNLSWASGAPGSHKLLSATHTDTLADDAVLGDLLYGSSTPDWRRLPGNITATRKFLGQTGTGTVSAAPDWFQPAFTDITGVATVGQLPATVVYSTRTLTATSPITGGGDLSADRSFGFDFSLSNTWTGTFNQFLDVRIRTSSTLAALSVVPATASNLGVVVKANTSQTSDLQDWQDSAGTKVSYISGDGYPNAAVDPTSATHLTRKSWTDSTYVPQTRNINTTSPIGGSGNLASDRTITCTTCVVTSRTLSATSPVRIAGGASADLSADRTFSWDFAISNTWSAQQNFSDTGTSISAVHVAITGTVFNSLDLTGSGGGGRAATWQSTSTASNAIYALNGGVRADTLFNINGTDGLTQTCSTAVIGLTIVGGIVTAATCP